MTPRKIFARAPVGKSAGSNIGMFNLQTDFDEVLCFDCETTTGIPQRLRIGMWQTKRLSSNEILSAGFFIADDMSEADLETVKAYASRFGDRLWKIRATEGKPARKDFEAAKPSPENGGKDGRPELLSGYKRRARAARAAYDPLTVWVCDRIRRGERAIPIYRRSQFALYVLDHLRNGGAIVGHNIGFDLSMISSLAWGHADTRHNRQGFHYSMCECAEAKIKVCRDEFGNFRKDQLKRICPHHPTIASVQLKGTKVTYGLSDNQPSGPIMDTVILGRAILGPGAASLDKMGVRFRSRIIKRLETSHGSALTFGYLDYLTTDVCASLELFERQVELFNTHGLEKPLALIFSEASVGKAYLERLGVPGDLRSRPFFHGLNKQPIKPQRYVDAAQEAYHGGRSEVRLRLTLARVAYCDYKSEYPTVNALMQLQQYMLASSYQILDGPQSVAKAHDILSRADHEWLQDRLNWPSMRMFVRIELAGCTLPIKWKDKSGKSPYGLVEFEGDGVSKWYAIADVIASKLLTRGHIPKILEAFEIIPGEPIADTRSMNLFNQLPVDLARDDLFTLIIETRTDVCTRRDKLEKNSAEWLALDAFQNALKLVANATSYGIFCESRMEGTREVGGKYYASWIGALICAGARLLLGMAETLARDIGERDLGQPIRYGMTDTDSMAFVLPDGASVEAFNNCINQVTGYFKPLSPYRNDDNLFARESSPKKGADADGLFWFMGVSCKRYVLASISNATNKETRSIKLHKVSSHGLGPYRFDDGIACSAEDIEPDDGEEDEYLSAIANAEAGSPWRPYQNFAWIRAIELRLGWRKPTANEAGLHAGIPIQPWSSVPTLLPVSITTPGRLAEFAKLGAVPGAFFVTMPTRPKSKLRIAAPFATRKADILASECRDVRTGAVIPPAVVQENLTPLYESLREYMVNFEAKAEGRGFGIAQSPGWLKRHKLPAASLIHKDRKGRATNQGDLFADDETEGE